MDIKTAEGVMEDGIVVGNCYDKYNTGNPIARIIMNGFKRNLSELVSLSSPASIHEVGCGEGYWVLKWCQDGYDARGSDFSKSVIAIAKENQRFAFTTDRQTDRQTDNYSICEVFIIYKKKQDCADLIVCCEVLEHLEEPERALKVLQEIVTKDLIISVPCEPLWRFMNLARGKYIRACGNTPGHIQHWSAKSFIKLVSTYFTVSEVRFPIPWVMLLCKRY